MAKGEDDRPEHRSFHALLRITLIHTPWRGIRSRNELRKNRNDYS